MMFAKRSTIRCHFRRMSDGIEISGGSEFTAPAAVLDVGEEHVPDEPAPAGAARARRLGVG
jgi:hypothetical protein